MANSPARSAIDVGSVIDKYVIEALIGRGGMGAVFVARHRTLTDKRVAIKVLHTEITDPDIQLRFKREAQIATRVNHPNIVEVHDFDVTPDGVPYLVLEYLEGQTLAQRLAQGPIPLDQVMTIVRQVGSALAAAHREGIVHRDLKPQNIFLVPMEVDGHHVEVAKVLDFGISKWRGSETVKTQESALLGTPQYMAPEQATGRHDSVDERTDVFALGSIVYEMLCGHPAFTGASIPEVVFKVVYEQPAPISDTVPDGVANAIRQAMAKPSEERFATVSNFVEALTGTELSTFRPSMITKPATELGFASGSKKISNPDALGDTMGSGDYGTAPTPVPIIVGPAVRGSSPTVDSVSSRGNASDPGHRVGLAATSAAPAPAKKPTLMILGGIAVVAATAAIMYFVMRKPEATATKPPEHQAQKLPATTPPDAAVQVAAVTPDAAVQVAAVTPDAATAVITPPDAGAVAATGTDAGVASKPPIVKDTPKPPIIKDTPKPPIVTDPPDEGGAADDDEDVKGMLKRANDAFRSGDYDTAVRLANAAVNRGGARQQAAGAMIKGLVACERKDLEGVNAALNQLGRNGGMRRRIITLCEKKGLDVR
ncbi:MAG: protein kinase [Myxococcales bacterium]|nr:protein kinase [Myxococcales bacterium]